MVIEAVWEDRYNTIYINLQNYILLLLKALYKFLTYMNYIYYEREYLNADIYILKRDKYREMKRVEEENNISEGRICSYCKIERPIEEFNVNNPKRSKPSIRCKECMRILYRAQYRRRKLKKNVEKKIYIPPTHKICQCCKDDKPINAFNACKNRKDKHATICKECVKKQRKYERCHTDKFKLWTIGTVCSHKRNGFEISFAKKELLLLAKKTSICHICGCELDWDIGKGKPQDNSPSLDRINNEKDMHMDNIQIICWRCNRLKRAMTMEEFYAYCRNITIRQFFPPL